MGCQPSHFSFVQSPGGCMDGGNKPTSHPSRDAEPILHGIHNTPSTTATAAFHPESMSPVVSSRAEALRSTPIVSVIAPPFAHRGKLCRQLSTEFDCHLVSWSDLYAALSPQAGFRAAEEDSYLRFISSGISAKDTMEFIYRKMAKLIDGRPFILDGFPIDIDQAMELEGHGLFPILVIHLDCPQDFIQRKIAPLHPQHGQKENQTFIENLEAYYQAEVELLDHYSKDQRLCKVSATSTYDAIYKDTKDIIISQRQKLNGGKIDILTPSASSPSPSKVNGTKSGERKPRLIILAGPSGVGKSVLIKKLKAEFPNSFGFSVSHTTREPREGEQHGVDYNFSNKTDIEREIGMGLFVEHAEVHGNLYGTSRAAVQKVHSSGRDCILDIDVKGCRQVKRDTNFEKLLLFIEPPSIQVLEERLRGRGTEKEDAIQRRLKNAFSEIEQSKEPGLFDKVIVNDVLDEAYGELKKMIFPNQSP